MPAKIQWTPYQDKIIKTWRAENKSWLDIALHLGLSRNTVIYRGSRLLVRTRDKPIQKPIEEEQKRVRHSANRAPLAAGHPLICPEICISYFKERQKILSIF